MKALFKLTPLLFYIFLFSCSEDFIEIENEIPSIQDNTLIAYPKKHSTTRSLTNNNWESWETVTLASGNIVRTPWNKNYTATAIPSDICRDIKPSSGWDLIIHTVNGYGEEGMNYLIFHNKYTGILKVFYYLERTQSALQNTAIWKLHFEIPQSCLAFSGDYATPANKKDISDIYLGNITNEDSKGYTLGWNCFQTELSYDPNLTGGTLQIIPSSMTTSNIHLSGNFDAETKGLIISTTNSNPLNNAVKGTAKFVGEKAESWVKKAVQGDAFKKISSLVVKGAGSLVSSGISSLLGSFIGGFNKEQQTVQSVQLNTTGTITLDGQITSLQSGIIMPLTFSISPNDVGKLGVWCLTDALFLRISPYALHKEQSSISVYAQMYEITGPYFYRTDLDDVFVLNPDLSAQIKRYDLSWEIYEVDSIVRPNALRQQFVDGRLPFLRDNLYRNLYLPTNNLVTDVYLKDQNGNPLENFEKYAPFEIYLPNSPEGTPGAKPGYSFNSRYIIAISVKIEVEQNEGINTIVSSHTFIPNIKWGYEQFNDGWYHNDYPSVPIIVNGQ